MKSLLLNHDLEIIIYLCVLFLAAQAQRREAELTVKGTGWVNVETKAATEDLMKNDEVAEL